MPVSVPTNRHTSSRRLHEFTSADFVRHRRIENLKAGIAPNASPTDIRVKLFSANSSVPDQLAPFGDVGFDDGGKFFRRAADGLHSAA